MASPSFDIEVTAKPEGRVEIALWPGSDEQIRVVVSNPIKAREVEGCIEILSRHKHHVTPLEQTKAARQFGQKLFNFLIGNQAAVYAAYIARIEETGTQGLALRLSLHDSGALPHLPWELLRDPERDFLALSENWSVSRLSSSAEARHPVPVVPPLRVLVAVAGREAAAAWGELETATAELRRAGRLSLERLEHASLDELRLRVLAEDYHVFHYLGFARFEEGYEYQKPFLVMRHEDRGFVLPDELNGELYPECTIRLAVLTPGRESFQPMSAFASHLRLPAVSLQFPLSRRALALFFQQFYGSLVEEARVERAVGRTRRALVNRLQTGEWAAPVLHTDALNHRLFYHLDWGQTAAKQSCR